MVQKDAVVEQANGLLEQFARYGITAVFDAGLPYMEDVIFPVIAELEQNGDLTIRISGSSITQRAFMTEQVMDVYEALRGRRGAAAAERKGQVGAGAR